MNGESATMKFLMEWGWVPLVVVIATALFYVVYIDGSSPVLTERWSEEWECVEWNQEYIAYFDLICEQWNSGEVIKTFSSLDEAKNSGGDSFWVENGNEFNKVYCHNDAEIIFREVLENTTCKDQILHRRPA